MAGNNSEGNIDTKGLKQERIPAVRSGEGHEVSFDIDGLPDEIYVGDTVSLVLFGTCSSGCDLREDVITIYEQATGKQIAQSTFVMQEDDLALTDGMLITLPDAPGDYQYRIHYEPHDLPMPDDGGPAFPNPHQARDLLLVLTTKAHHVALSTWGVTAPVWVGEPIEVCVGASCSDSCSLAGCKVEIYDADGALQATGTLHEPEDPRPTLWWDKIVVDKAPEEAKLHRWEARFVGSDDLEAPHEAPAHKFSFVARARPEREFVAVVIDEKADKPQRSARVELKPKEGKSQFGTTDANGKVSIGCSKGAYELKVTAPSRRTYTATVDLTDGDLEVEVHLQPTGTTGDLIPLKVLSSGAEVVEQAVEAVADVVEAAVAEASPDAAPEAQESQETSKTSN